MSKDVSLKDFYNNPDLEEEEEGSEEDSDFIPDENESDADDDKDLEEEDGEEETEEKAEISSSGNNKKRSLPEEEGDIQSKKSRIDAIWADMNSKEESKKAEIEATGTATTAAASTSASVMEETKTTVAKKKKSPLNQRPKSSLSSLVSQYNIKEPKLNTLEKSKLDWQGYVDREGIREDLKYKNKDGYMEKVAFLQRVDDRRLSQLKTGQKKDMNGKK